MGIVRCQLSTSQQFSDKQSRFRSDVSMLCPPAETPKRPELKDDVTTKDAPPCRRGWQEGMCAKCEEPPRASNPRGPLFFLLQLQDQPMPNYDNGIKPEIHIKYRRSLRNGQLLLSPLSASKSLN